MALLVPLRVMNAWLTFPEDYHQKNSRRSCGVQVSVKEVKTLEPAELNAELFAAYGVEGDMSTASEQKFARTWNVNSRPL